MLRVWRDYYWTTGWPWRVIRPWLVPRILQTLHSILMLTLRITVSGAHQLTPFLDRPAERGVVLVTWHDLTLLPLHLFRDKNITILASRSRAGQMQAAFWRLYGWPNVWGSSTRKRDAIKALREMLRLLREGQSLAFAPDGPKGPRHQVQPGVVYLAANAPATIIPLGVAADKCWRLNTWDRYFIPRPFAHVHIHLGEAMIVPPNGARDDVEMWQQRVQEALDAAIARCEREVGIEPQEV